MIIVVARPAVKPDMKAESVTGGKGLEVGFHPDDSDPAHDTHDTFEDPDQLCRQHVYVELGVDWFGLYP